MKVLLIVANGQLGTDMHRVFRNAGDTVFPYVHAQLDVCSESRVAEVLDETQPDLVLNTAAYHRVEECEKKSELAFQVNGTAPMQLAIACQKASATLVHFSTDYVFGGYAKNTPYDESDRPAPLNVYGASKVLGEYLIPDYTDRYFILRVCGLYGTAGSSGKGGNFVETMLKKGMAGDNIRVVDDQVLTPTYTVDLAEAVRKLVMTEKYGLYHLTSEGECSWFDFTRHIFESAGIQAKLSPVKSTEFASPVKRPSYSVLSKAKARAVGVSLPSWKDALPRYLKQRTQKTSATPVHVTV